MKLLLCLIFSLVAVAAVICAVQLLFTKQQAGSVPVVLVVVVLLFSLGWFLLVFALFIWLALSGRRKKDESSQLPSSRQRETWEPTSVIRLVEAVGRILQVFANRNGLIRDRHVDAEFSLELKKQRLADPLARGMRDISFLAATLDPHRLEVLERKFGDREQAVAVLTQIEFAKRIRPASKRRPARGNAYFQATAKAFFEWSANPSSLPHRVLMEQRLLEGLSFDERLIWRLHRLGLSSREIQAHTGISRTKTGTTLKEVQRIIGEISTRIPAARPHYSSQVDMVLDEALSFACEGWMENLVVSNA